MAPAQQRLDAEHGAAAQIDLRLIVESELVALERLLHAPEGLVARLGLAAVLGVEEQVAAAARLLGAVHRMVGVAQHGVGVGPVERIDGGADAGRDLHRRVARQCGERRADDAEQPLHREPAFLERDGLDQQHELVTAEARDDVAAAAAAQGVAQPAGDLDQHAVAGGMADVVVQPLEVVEVEIAHDQQMPVGIARLHRLLQQLAETQPVRQLRQRIEMDLPLELFALQPAGGDVGDDHRVACRAVRRGARRDGDLQARADRRCGAAR